MTVQTSPKMQIPFFRYPHLFNQQRQEILDAVVRVMERGAFILQSDLTEFEVQLAQYVGVKYAVGVANGTDSLIIAMHAAGIGAGDEVIVPSHTYVASVASIHFAGATPVLVECGADHMVDPSSVEAAVTSRTKAIMPVQLNGRVCDMDRIGAIAKRHNLAVIEDAAQGLGARFKGKMAGSFGLAGSFSFYPAKVLGCFGDGGGLTINDADIARKVRLLRDHGRNDDGLVVTWGLNSRLDNLHAAILNVKFRQFEQEIERRRRIASLYTEGLGELEDMTLPPAPDADPNHFDVYQNYEVESGCRTALRSHLEKNGVRTIIQWAGTPVHQFEGLGLGKKRKLPVTDRLFERCFLLPMNTSLTDDEVAYICEIIRSFYGIDA
jgi:dTDP-4-amino-4,6-dideoxygalactose transaminase